MPLLVAEILNKRYRIVSLLAAGAYGAVYRGWDMEAGMDVAIKEYLDPAPEIQRLFRAEARRLSRLEHPQLPAVRDHFVLEETGQYLIFDFVPGVSLQQLLDQYGTLPEDLIIHWLQEAAVPLTYLHEQGQLHLNIKPANIRLTPAGEVYLVDTGLPGLGTTPGRSGFAAPEQQKQAETSVATDVYGLGATLYALLTGRIPPDALRRESRLEECVPAREVNPDVSPYLSVAAARAMDMRPEVRYETVADLARALSRPGGSRSAEATDPLRRTTLSTTLPAPAPKRPQPIRKQIEMRVILGLLMILLLAIGIGAGITLVNRSIPVGGSEVAATATTQSQIIDALTQLAPTVTPTAPATETPLPTPGPIVDSLSGARMLYVPQGPFRMGNDERDPDEAPSFLARIDAYYIDETEVTNSMYAKCVAAEVCGELENIGASYHPFYYGAEAFDDYPVLFVNWYDAQTFCEWRGARLPTEAEWERAAGFDPALLQRYTYSWGDAFDGRMLNYCDSNCPAAEKDIRFDDGHQDTSPAGSYPDGRSPIGAYDMLGNVMEWVNDWYDPRYYASASSTNPMGPVEGETKVIRGGSWLSSADQVSVTGRSAYDPTVRRATVGFRCAMEMP